MGIYLSTPCTDVSLEQGSGEKVQFVVGEMQGWRQSMEDAHIALADIKCNFQDGNSSKINLFAVFDGHGGKEVAKFAKLKYPELVLEQLIAHNGDVAVALRESFHRIDELLEEPEHLPLLKQLRSVPNPSDNPSRGASSGVRGHTLEDSDSDSEGDRTTTAASAKGKAAGAPVQQQDGDESADQALSTSEAVKLIRDMLRQASERGKGDEEEVEGEAEDEEKQPTTSTATSARSSKPLAPASSGLTVTMHENTPAEDEQEHSTGNALLLPGTEVGALLTEDGEEVSPKPNHMEAEEDMFPGAAILPATPSLASALKRAPLTANLEPVVASRVGPKGPTCALKPHQLMAGCTAVVALQLGDQLFVANAGDSRGVMCRKGGRAYALSYDHKPQEEKELERITNAGGFVNAVGRINGNLNLSRALGDLKYKQVVQYAREHQIITAEPDVTLTQLEAGDRFFILACDGVWDCLSNQQACDFVSERLDRGLDTASIAQEVLHHCLAKDTSSSCGIGCDNMTFLLVLLQ